MSDTPVNFFHLSGDTTMKRRNTGIIYKLSIIAGGGCNRKIPLGMHAPRTGASTRADIMAT